MRVLPQEKSPQESLRSGERLRVWGIATSESRMAEQTLTKLTSKYSLSHVIFAVIIGAGSVRETPTGRNVWSNAFAPRVSWKIAIVAGTQMRRRSHWGPGIHRTEVEITGRNSPAWRGSKRTLSRDRRAPPRLRPHFGTLFDGDRRHWDKTRYIISASAEISAPMTNSVLQEPAPNEFALRHRNRRLERLARLSRGSNRGHGA